MDCEESIIEEIRNRKERGLVKYGISLSDNPLTEYEILQHAKEEALDLALYLQKRQDMIINATP